MPLNEKEYLAVPASMLVPGGISALSVIEESLPGMTGSGRREPLVNLKTDVPFEQSVTELVADAFRIATVATSAVKRPITYLWRRFFRRRVFRLLSFFIFSVLLFRGLLPDFFGAAGAVTGSDSFILLLLLLLLLLLNDIGF